MQIFIHDTTQYYKWLKQSILKKALYSLYDQKIYISYEHKDLEMQKIMYIKSLTSFQLTKNAKLYNT